jgi:hypothetical protein
MTKIIESVEERLAMFETLLSQNVCVYVIVMCGFMGVVGRMIMGGCFRRLIKETETMGRTRKRALREIRKRYEDISLLDVEVRDTAAFVDKYIDRLKIGLISVNAWNAFIKNLGVIAAGTGIFAAVYQYHVVGDGGETVKLLMSALAADMALLLAYNQWNPSLYMKTLRDSVMNYLGNNLSNRFCREDRRQMAAAAKVPEEVEGDAATVRAACSSEIPVDKKRTKSGPRTDTGRAARARSEGADYDKLLDKMMQKILADG